LRRCGRLRHTGGGWNIDSSAAIASRMEAPLPKNDSIPLTVTSSIRPSLADFASWDFERVAKREKNCIGDEPGEWLAGWCRMASGKVAAHALASGGSPRSRIGSGYGRVVVIVVGKS